MRVAPENQSVPQSGPSWWDRNKKLVIWTCIAFLLGSGLACAIILPITLPTGKGSPETTLSSTSSTTINTAETSSTASRTSTTSTTSAIQTSASTEISTSTPTTSTPPDCQQWEEWNEWTDCSVTCGPGTITRSRECRVGGLDAQIEVDDCFIESCVSGLALVHSVTHSLRTKDIEDNLFLNRYAHRVTNFGAIINQNDNDEAGYGIWRLTEAKLNIALDHQLEENLLLYCNLTFESIEIGEVKKTVNEVPCASAVALITLLQKAETYPPPIAMDNQNDIFDDLTAQAVIPWERVLQEEQSHIQNKCLQSDVDFDFVIDSSGSVGLDYWNITMSIIGNHGIKQNILPIGSKTCGNHIAGRWFSDSTKRFYDLKPPDRSEFHPETYPNFVGEKFVNEPFHKGGTDTAKALKAVREEDVPTEGFEAKIYLMHCPSYTERMSSLFCTT